MKAGIVAGITLAISAVVVCFVPLVNAAYTVTVNYEDTETYYEDEPYKDTETYYVDEPYQAVETYLETETLEYHIVEHHYGYAMEDLPTGAEPPCAWAFISLLNTDTASGTFTIHFYLTVERLTPIGEDRFELVSNDYQDSRELHLEPGEIGTWEKYWTEIDLAPEDNCRWGYEATGSNTIEKQRTVTKYRQVEKQRTVTKYRQVAKERPVTKQHQEMRFKRVTMLDYLLRY